MRQIIYVVSGLILFFLLFSLPHPEGMSFPAHSVACVSVLMGFWWLTEAIPIPATALIPLVAFPLLKIKSVSETSVSYGDSYIYLFLGGFFIAIALEKWDLHKRIALHIINFIGTSKRRIILGFMISTAFLSMWISNTATTLMMYPIGLAVIQSLEEVTDSDKRVNNAFASAIMLTIAFSASIGGLGTLIGTPPNIIFVATMNSLFPNAPSVSFTKWFLMVFPLVCIFVPIGWWYIVNFGFCIPKELKNTHKELISQKLIELGRITREEVVILVVFIITALGWIFRRDLNIGAFTIPGWSDFLGLNKYSDDTLVVMCTALFLFIFPVNFHTGQRLLNWDDVKKIPWGVLILFGGGIALADGFRSTELSVWIANGIAFFKFLPPLLMVTIISIVMIILTEFTSNTATASIFMPILASLAVATNIHPYVLMIPATIAVSLAFMLPVATPPNAIIFGSGRVKINEMFRVGLVFDIIGLLLIVLLLYLIIFPVAGINPAEFPSWGK